MPKQSELNRAVRIVECMKVLQLMFQGQTKTSACQETGIALSTFDVWISKNETVLVEMQDVLLQAEKDRFAMLNQAQTVILGKLMIYATTETTILDTASLLKLSRYFGELIDKIDAKLHISEAGFEADRYLEEFMKGPVTKIEESKMLQHEEEAKEAKKKTKLNVKPLEDGSVDITLEKPQLVVDSDFVDPEHDS